MNVLITGSHGLIGARLVVDLRRAGHIVVAAVRGRPASADEVTWEPASGRIESTRPYDAVIYLAGQNLASGRWTSASKHRAWSSRVEATRALCQRLATAAPAPRVMLCASAIGIYGDRADEPLDESSPPSSGFPADLAVAWEAACQPLAAAGTRVVNLRIGLVLAPEGGALPPLLRVARLGLGGPLGSGRQFWSWVAIEDVVAAFRHVLERDDIDGPFNVVGPEPVQQRDFARALGRVLKRPAFIPTPAWALRALLGEMSDKLLLASARVLPRRLLATGFTFLRVDVESALRAALVPRG